jgi:hypothetical protein
MCGDQEHQPSSDAMLGPAKADPDFEKLLFPISRLGMVSKPRLVADALLKIGTAQRR